jgi:hypothetical protein
MKGDGEGGDYREVRLSVVVNDLVSVEETAALRRAAETRNLVLFNREVVVYYTKITSATSSHPRIRRETYRK